LARNLHPHHKIVQRILIQHNGKWHRINTAGNTTIIFWRPCINGHRMTLIKRSQPAAHRDQAKPATPCPYYKAYLAPENFCSITPAFSKPIKISFKTTSSSDKLFAIQLQRLALAIEHQSASQNPFSSTISVTSAS
jgi:hypothetical protein